MMNYILIDTSYLIFYRYFALLQWWRVAHPDDDLGNPAENLEFKEKFVKQIVEAVDNIRRSLRLHSNRRQNPPVKVLLARDCPRKNIWRNEYFTQYKATREKDDDFMGGEFFKMVYRDKLLERTGADMILYENFMEADDIIAVTANYIKENHKGDYRIYIIANDMDYLQLWDDRCDIVNLQGKYLVEKKNSYRDGDKNLFMKIVLGDKSDNIQAVFKRCSVKEAESYYDNPDIFAKRLDEEDCYERLLLNKTIIDFDEIPEELQYKITKKLDKFVV
jgi:5'-3' exonuclease